jgi:hypothetical protein
MKNKSILILQIFVLLLVSFAFCGLSYAGKDKVKKKEWVDKTFYTGVNIWFEKPKGIVTTNFHRGDMLAAGTQIKVTKAKKDYLKFIIDGKKYRLIYAAKHHRKVTMNAVLKRTFFAENPMEGSNYSGFSKMEKDNIKAGTIEKGMSKNAVLMAYGYPPDHKTPSTDENVWTYWISRFQTTILSFDNSGTLIDIK